MKRHILPILSLCPQRLCLSAQAGVKFLFALILGGCAVGPDYVRPDMKMPRAFKEMGEWKVAEPGDLAAKGQWRKIFADPLLDRLEDRVLADNLSIQIAEAQFRQARALVQVARASYFPSLSALAGFSRGNTTSALTNANQMAPAVNTYNVGLDASWEADVWGRVRRTVEANTASAEASAALLAGTKLSMQASVAQYYFQLRVLDAQKELLEKTVAAYEKSVDLTTHRYEGGVASKADVMQAVTQLKTTRAQAIDVTVQRAQLEHAIAVLTGQMPSDFSIAFEPIRAVPPSVPRVLPSHLLERRPDIASYERQVAAANAAIGVAKAAYFPVLTVSADASTRAAERSALFTMPTRRWSVGPNLSETIIDWGLRRAKNDQAIAAYDQSVAAYRQAVLASLQEVEDNLAVLRILENEAAVQKEAVEAALLSLDLVNNQYQAGIVAYSSVITAQATALANQRTALTILNNRLTASVLLIKALGGGWNTTMLPKADDLK